MTKTENLKRLRALIRSALREEESKGQNRDRVPTVIFNLLDELAAIVEDIKRGCEVKNLLVVLFVSLVVAGCAGGGHSKAPSSNPGAVPPPALAAGIPASTVIHWTGGPNGNLSVTDKDVVKIAGNWQFDAWTTDFKMPAPVPASIEFVNADTLDSGPTSETLNGNMRTVVDNKRAAEGVYHELCHMFLLSSTGDQDAGHTDPRWAQWNAQAAASTQGLLDWRKKTGALGPTQ